MLTLFTAPKPFRGHIAIIQRNAIQSWLQLRPACEIILLGDEEGTADVAGEFGLRYIPEVARNEYGTPLLSSLFELAQTAASRPLLAYVNADIILLSDFVAAVRRIPFRRFVMVGHRWDVDLKLPWDFSLPAWETALRAYISGRAVRHGPSGIDYFVFPAGLWGPIPPFAVGRPAWDNWMIYRAYALGAAVVDATQVVTAIHQAHDYTHVASRSGPSWEGPEAQHNRALVGKLEYKFNLRDANWRLSRRWLLPQPALTARRKYWYVCLRRYAKELAARHPYLGTVLRALTAPRKLLASAAHYIQYRVLKQE